MAILTHEKGALSPAAHLQHLPVVDVQERVRPITISTFPCHVPRTVLSSIYFLHSGFPDPDMVCWITYCLLNINCTFLQWDTNILFPQCPLGRSFMDLLPTERKKQLFPFVLNLIPLIACRFYTEIMLSFKPRESSNLFCKALTWHFLALLQDHVFFYADIHTNTTHFSWWPVTCAWQCYVW